MKKNFYDYFPLRNSSISITREPFHDSIKYFALTQFLPFSSCSMGFCILVLYGAQLLYENVSKLRRVLEVSGILLVCFFCMKTITRNEDWHTRESLLK
jgi:hypothetical protein